jgi:hypothetical protein
MEKDAPMTPTPQEIDDLVKRLHIGSMGLPSGLELEAAAMVAEWRKMMEPTTLRGASTQNAQVNAAQIEQLIADVYRIDAELSELDKRQWGNGDELNDIQRERGRLGVNRVTTILQIGNATLARRAPVPPAAPAPEMARVHYTQSGVAYLETELMVAAAPAPAPEMAGEPRIIQLDLKNGPLDVVRKSDYDALRATATALGEENAVLHAEVERLMASDVKLWEENKALQAYIDCAGKMLDEWERSALSELCARQEGDARDAERLREALTELLELCVDRRYDLPENLRAAIDSAMKREGT